MSTDKLNTLVASNAQFIPGERLKAEKLNYLIELLESNINHLGAAIGDIYDENVSTGLDERSEWGKRFNSNSPTIGSKKRRFDIANLARLIGSASNLNPQAFLYDVFHTEITETIPENVIEYCTKYPVKSPFTISINGYTLAANNNKNNLVNSNNFYVENNTIYFSTQTSSEVEINYNTDPRQYNGGPNYQGASFNVYPDPNQDNTENKLTVKYIQDGSNISYKIILPTIQNQQGSFGGSFETTSLENRDINLNEQLKWPEWIRDLDNDPNIIPPYSLYLKNYTLNESYLDAVYTKISDTEILVTELQIGNQECIDEFDLRVVTVGTDITTSIDDLRNKMFLHNHDGSFGEPKVNIKNIAGFYEAEVEGGSGPYYPSSSVGNPISNYLHKDGYKANSDVVNGDNAMRGPLMMGLNDFDPITNRVIASDEVKTSNALLFGSIRTFIQRVSTDGEAENELSIKNQIGDVKLSSPSNDIVGLSNSYRFVGVEDSRLTLSADASLNLNEGFKIKQLDNMPHNVERINLGYQIYEMPYYKLMLKNPFQYTLPSSTTQFNDGNLYVDAFDIHSTGDNAVSLGDDYSYPTGSNIDTDPVESSNRFKNFYELESGSSDKGEFLNLNRGANDFTVEYYWGNKELNANLFFDLSRNTASVISPLYRLSPDTGQYRYRAFEIHIFRGCSWEATLGDQLNDLSKKFSAEYQIQIDMDSMTNTVDGSNPSWVNIPAIFLHYDYYKSTPTSSNSLGIENYLIDRGNGFSVFESDANATTFFADRNIRRVETPFNTLRDNLLTNNPSLTNNNIETTARVNNYSTQSHSTVKINLSSTGTVSPQVYTSDGEALSRFTLNIKEEFWNGVFSVGIH